MKPSRPTILVLLALLVGCVAPIPQQADSREAEEAAILEAVFRYQYEHNSSGAQSNVDFYFLSFGSIGENEDPSLAFMARFEGHSPKVEPVSLSITSAQSTASILSTASAVSGVSHEEHGGRGLIFRIEHIRWIDGHTVEVDGGYYEARRSSSGNTYKVERRRGRWVVTDDRMLWIS